MSESRGGARLIPGILIILAIAVWSWYDEEGVFAGEASGGSTSDNVIFGPRESGRLIERLDAAWKAQGICYGWEIDSGRAYGVPSVVPSYSSTFRPSPAQSAPLEEQRPGVETGSNLGVGTDPRRATAQCGKWVVLKVEYSHGYNGDENEPSDVNVEIDSNLTRRPAATDLAAAGITTSSLLGDDSTGRLADAVGALPMIVTEQGDAPAVPEGAAQTAPPGDRAAEPGKGRFVWMGIAVIMILGGLAWVASAVRSRRRGPLPQGNGRYRSAP